MKPVLRSIGFPAIALLVGCATTPSGPSVMSLPGTAANFDQFRTDDMDCQAYARHATGQVTSQHAASTSGVNSAAVGTVVGAAAGALLGAASGNPGAGAAIGAGGGLIIGSAAGTDAYAVGGMATQDRYDNAYVQCMYANGHQVPVSSSVAANLQPATPSAGAYPPPGTPPPPGY
ncbi:MAG: hypothetical protein EXR86_02305 [Gammaproteobacteria bacterium]|nr:hypothetical protein [Gammaproteobacteria bacterium]